MCDDLNTADALAAVFEYVRDMNTQISDANAPCKVLATNALDVLDEAMSHMELIHCPEDDRWITIP